MSVGLGRNGNGVLRMVRLGVYMHWCLGCGKPHEFNINGSDHPQGKAWGWDGDWERPSVEPELEFPGCRYILRAGHAIYDRDSTHAFAGQTMRIPAFPLQRADRAALDGAAAAEGCPPP